jgi:4-hydroxybutyrate dehydrogenase
MPFRGGPHATETPGLAMVATINYLTRIEFGASALKTLPAILRDLGATRPLIVSDHGIKNSGILDRVFAALGETVPAFLDVPANPGESAVLSALDLYRAENRDSIVAVGGGSPIDLAKAVALLDRHPLPLRDYAAIHGGVARISNRIPPVVAVPTTAGTGSEVGRAALITLADGSKLGLISPYLIPRVALCDPELTLGLPKFLTAATGLDALTHCIETYLSPRANPPADAIALDGAERVWRNIGPACDDGGDIAVRAEMMMGALQGGLTFQKGLGAVHSLSHALGSLSALKLHHGTLNAILLPSVLRFNEPAAAAKIRTLERRLGIPERPGLAAAIDDLNRRLELPARLRTLGFTESMVPGVVEKALADHSHATNPRIATRDDYIELLTGVL